MQGACSRCSSLLCCSSVPSSAPMPAVGHLCRADGGQLQSWGTAGTHEWIQDSVLCNQKLLLLLLNWLGRYFPSELHDALLVSHLCSRIHCTSVPDCNCSHKYSFLSRDQVLLKSLVRIRLVQLLFLILALYYTSPHKYFSPEPGIPLHFPSPQPVASGK